MNNAILDALHQLTNTHDVGADRTVTVKRNVDKLKAADIHANCFALGLLDDDNKIKESVLQAFKEIV